MLLLAEVDLILQKKSCKQNSDWPNSSADGKIVLTLLTKVITLYVGPTAVNVWGLGLEFVSRSTFGGMDKCLDDFI